LIRSGSDARVARPALAAFTEPDSCRLHPDLHLSRLRRPHLG
jgi:hypothetical protein